MAEQFSLRGLIQFCMWGTTTECIPLTLSFDETGTPQFSGYEEPHRIGSMFALHDNSFQFTATVRDEVTTRYLESREQYYSPVYGTHEQQEGSRLSLKNRYHAMTMLFTQHPKLVDYCEAYMAEVKSSGLSVQEWSSAYTHDYKVNNELYHATKPKLMAAVGKINGFLDELEIRNGGPNLTVRAPAEIEPVRIEPVGVGVAMNIIARREQAEQRIAAEAQVGITRPQLNEMPRPVQLAARLSKFDPTSVPPINRPGGAPSWWR